jgi:hypothetical protein
MIITAGTRMQWIHTTHEACFEIQRNTDTHGLMTALNSIGGCSGYTALTPPPVGGGGRRKKSGGDGM